MEATRRDSHVTGTPERPAKKLYACKKILSSFFIFCYNEPMPAFDLKIIENLIQKDSLAERDFQKIQQQDSFTFQNPEKKLSLAILEDAVQVIFKLPGTPGFKPGLFAEAYKWIKSENHRHVFSFICICETCGFDADWIRKGILNKLKVIRRERRKNVC